MKKRIETLSEALYNDVRNHYRHLHQHPELSFKEEQTARYIIQELQSIGIPFREKIGGNGIVATLRCAEPKSRIVGLRADMDALPIEEQTELPFASCNKGVMHACGHDAHVACLLGVARLLHTIKDSLTGTYHFVFQPAEELYPGGANLMLKEDLFGEEQPRFMLAQHVYVDIPVGSVAIGGGTVMASADEVHITVKGRGGHGALPHLLNDTVLAAAQTVVSLQQFVSRRTNPFHPMVLTFGRISAEGATNIIPDKVTMSGSLRCMDQEERTRLRPLIEETIRQTASAYGCEAEVYSPDGYPPTKNDDALAQRASQLATELLGNENLHPLLPRMTSEDFGFFTQRYPSLFYRFGVKSEYNQSSTGLHTAHFFIDERALLTGVKTLAYLAVEM